MKKILVTGGTGYIGSHTVVELFEAGYSPIIIDNLSNSNIGVLDQIKKITGTKPEFHNLDLCDENEVKNFVNGNPDIEGVIHFAASKAVGESVEKPLKYYHNNLFSLINLLKAFSDRKINFVFSSSCTVYGQPDELPVTERAEVKKAESPYGNTKQIAEEILQETANSNQNFNILSLRYFNPVGAHESALIGELPLGVPQNLVPFITQTAIGKREQLSVFGDDYPTIDGTCIRDYIHVVDLAKAHVIALGRLLDKNNKTNYEVFNLGTGTGSSVLEVIQAFERVSGEKLNYRIAERREGDVVSVYADTQKANEELGWMSQLTLEDAMRSAWKWEQKIANS